ncbi:MAG: DUF3099 domain-containing protein [Sinomonas sp.]|nr:DUF3099 domain-containing protein [Sinomonas sp.]
MMKRLTDGTTPGADNDRTSEDPEVHSITTAAPSHSEDMRKRMVRYATAMGIRMVCIILLFVVDGWFKLVAAIGAVFLPWVAVVIANAGDRADTTSDSLLEALPPAELEAGRGAEPDEDVVLTGEVVEGEDDGGQAAEPDGSGTGDDHHEGGEEKRSA